jgi:hypothetical protein
MGHRLDDGGRAARRGRLLRHRRDDGLGWLTDRITRACCWPFTAACAGSRLLALPALVGPSVEPPLLVVVALFGLDWVATIPPTVVLYRAAFGPEPGGIAT